MRPGKERYLRSMSDTRQNRATLLRNFVFNRVASANNHQTNMASTGTDDDISSALLIASTLSQRHQLVNVRKCKRNSRARKQTIDHSLARRQNEKLPKNRNGVCLAILVARLVKSWPTRDVRRATKISRQICSTLLLV